MWVECKYTGLHSNILKMLQYSLINSPSTHSPLTLHSLSPHLPLTLPSPSTHSPLTLLSLSPHPPLTLPSPSTHSPLTFLSLSPHPPTFDPLTLFLPSRQCPLILPSLALHSISPHHPLGLSLTFPHFLLTLPSPSTRSPHQSREPAPTWPHTARVGE